MPIYEYQCDGCEQVFEVFQKHTDPPPARHACGSAQVRRVLSNTSFVLKGTGWYATDYGNRKDGDAAAKKRERGGKDAKDVPSTAAGKESKDDKGSKGQDKATGDGGKPSAGASTGSDDGKPPRPKKGNGGGGSAAA